MRLTVSGSADFGRKVTANLQRNGDLITNMYLRVKVDAATTNDATKTWAWVSKLGHSLINSVELNIGGTKIDKQYGDWMNIWYELSRNFAHDRGYDKMIGNTADLTTLAQSHKKTTLYIPLYFFCCRNDGLALPLIALTIAGLKSNQPQTFGHCLRTNMLGSQYQIPCC